MVLSVVVKDVREGEDCVQFCSGVGVLWRRFWLLSFTGVFCGFIL